MFYPLSSISTHSTRHTMDVSACICIRSIIYCSSINESGYILSRCVNFPFVLLMRKTDERETLLSPRKANVIIIVHTHTNKRTQWIQLKSAVSALEPHTCNKTLHSSVLFIRSKFTFYFNKWFFLRRVFVSIGGCMIRIASFRYWIISFVSAIKL